MKSKDLLHQLSNLEAQLNNFSFEELSSNDATRLKKSFQSFKRSLEAKVFENEKETTTLEDVNFQNELDPIASSKIDEESMLIARVSHEIRTPLNGIIGFTDLLLEDALSETQHHHVQAIQSASHTLMDIINELLEFSKLSAGLEHFESIDFNIYSIVRDVMYLCNTLIIDKNVKLEVDIDTQIPEVIVGDPSKLSQVLLNLIGNSIKFVEKGDICLKITQNKRIKKQHVLTFEISDTGIGISEENLKHIFDSFRQAEFDTANKYGGSGLGLSIVKQIIENQGGQIKMASNLGIGTTVKFTLPFIKGDLSRIPKTTDSGIDQNEQIKLVNGMRILVFEDNLLNQKLIEQRLNSWKCKTYITDNPLYGLNILENNRIDLVLMDLRMPKMNGFQVTERIRANKNVYIKQIPIVALTADFTIKDRDECNTHGINDYILKPYSPDELLSKLIKNKNDMDTLYIVESDIINPNSEQEKMNLAPILEECMGEIDLLEELVHLYKQNALEFIGKAKMHLKDGDINELEFAAHKIKSGLAMMKTYGLHAIVDQMYRTCKTSKDEKHLAFLYDCFVEEYPKVENVLNIELEKLTKK